jgi:hypothetical protein
LWAKSAVRAILVNPRYTGFEVWNNPRKDEVLINVGDVALGHQTKMRWNDTAEWFWSPEPRHEPLVTRDEYEAAQAQFDRTTRATRRTPAAGRQHVLAGILHCGSCGRRMQGQWNHDRAY